jgi:hypothetical protein
VRATRSIAGGSRLSDDADACCVGDVDPDVLGGALVGGAWHVTANRSACWPHP